MLRLTECVPGPDLDCDVIDKEVCLHELITLLQLFCILQVWGLFAIATLVH